MTLPTLFQAYSEALRRHAHELIALGYERMDKAAFARQQEPAITGELVRKMRVYLESCCSESGHPAWLAHYTIHDDPPVNADGRLGRSRRRVDIEFERVVAGERPRLQFEAKRLSSTTGHATAGYLGNDGLGCFLSGKYPLTHGEAGMLGYVQSASENAWAEKIASRFGADPDAYGVVQPPLEPQRIAAALDHTWVSRHRMSASEDPIIIHHVMLRFMPT